MATFFHVIVARIRGFLRPGDLESDFPQELEIHLTMAEEDKIRQGMTREQARRQARVERGGLTQLREASRAARGLPWIGGFWLDFKLGLRMLRNSWGLTLVGGLAMTVAIAIAALVFAVFDTIWGSALTLDEGDRVVCIQTWNVALDRPQTSLRDFELWSEALQSLENVGAFQTVERSLAIADGLSESVFVAEMTASGFKLARVPPLQGRPLVEEDERDSADPVVVIGYAVWQSRFSGDPEVIGRRVRLGAADHTVVGVMPPGFGFPVNHSFWTPLRIDRVDDVRDGGPDVFVFARLAPGIGLEGAQAELTSIGLPPPASPETPQRLEPRLVSYTVAFNLFSSRWVRDFILLLVSLLLVPPCANIAILVYARTVTRQEEFAARHALGASRGRIVVQLFVEMLVLAVGAAGVALVLVRLAFNHLLFSEGDDPFWWDISLSFPTVVFAAGLAVFAALIVGAVPALQATGRLMQSGLRSLGSRTGMQLGPTWTGLVVAQIAFAVAVLPTAVEWSRGMLRPDILGPGFEAGEFMTARLTIDRKKPPDADDEAGRRQFNSRLGTLQAELVRQLETEADISAVAVSAAVPGEEPSARVEIGGVTPFDDGWVGANHFVQINQVDDVFFELFDVPRLTGRPFDAGDLEPERATTIVSRAFAQELLGDESPLGRRVRYRRTQSERASESVPWYEIVGVVDDLPANTNSLRMYLPMALGQRHSVTLMLRVEPTAAGVAGRLLAMTTALDPALRLEELRPLDEIYREQMIVNNLGTLALGAVTLCVLLLSAAGLYALMSFTVNQRRREIGIRSAMGAQPHRLLAGIFRRALGQVAAGAIFGVLAALLLDYYLPMEELGGWNVPGVVPAAAALMIGIGLLATAGPARRGLRVDPIEELRNG